MAVPFDARIAVGGGGILGQEDALRASSPLEQKTLAPQYSSLFDRIDFAQSATLAYDGSLGEVMAQLHGELLLPAVTPDGLLRRVLHPPRIIRSIIDDKITHPGSTSTDLLQKAVLSGLAVYRGTADAESRLLDLETSLMQAGKEYIFHLPLKQVDDRSTWMAMRPVYSKKSASLLAEYTQGAPLLFIPLAHGAVGVGMDLFLRYCEKTASGEKSIFYPVRDSQHKQSDIYPKVTDEEQRFLRDNSVGRTVVVFDEDVNTGITIENANDYFRYKVFGKKLVTLTNNNQRNQPEIDIKIDTSFLSDL
jgi:hypothetical protein